MSEVYHGLFCEWDDVVMNFAGVTYADEADQKRARLSIPEPDEVLLAAYEYEDYSGDAVVIYRNGDKFYMNFGGHCSCHGLEDQWSPEEYDRDTALAYWEKMRDDGYGLQQTFAPQIIERIKASSKNAILAAAERELEPAYEATF